METVLIQINNSKAYKLLEDLEDLHLLTVLKKTVLPQKGETTENSSKLGKKSMADFSGTLSETDYQSLKEHAEQTRKEWERNI